MAPFDTARKLQKGGKETPPNPQTRVTIRRKDDSTRQASGMRAVRRDLRREGETLCDFAWRLHDYPRPLAGPWSHWRTLLSMSNLAIVLNDEGRYAEAEKLDRETLDTQRRVLGPENMARAAITRRSRPVVLTLDT
jgi:hypothetical protein